MSCTTRDAGARQELREECQSIRVHQERYLDQLQKIHRASRTAMTPQRMMVLIQVEFLSEDDDDEWSKWAKFVEVEIEAMTKEAALYRGALQELDAILQAYKRHYGSTWDEIDEEESYDGAEEGHSVATYSSLV